MDYAITLRLSGRVDLDDFVVAITKLKSLIKALNEEVASGVEVDWNVQSLEAGSATATFEGVATEEDRQIEVEKIIRAYEEVGDSIERGLEVPYSPAVSKAAFGILDVLGEQIDEIFFETEEKEAVITRSLKEDRLTPAMSSAERDALYSYGAIEGRVQTLSSRTGLRFTLFDVFGRSIPCHLSKGDEDMMRNAWDKWVVVEGFIRRNSQGKPVSIRRVSDVMVRDMGEVHGYRKARGALKYAGPRTISAEDAIRLSRDA
ncbi:hypothetical protein [Rubrobacter indicoceani]|uniref:hypothetical protein n=1 Tax=Rubrobacter indicoceani TaxID=2051957 RepID=UPI000E5A3E30|nr:hypothetical protein [Rubrobacter indicoceani]